MQGAADGEGAVGDVVGFAGGPLSLAVVDEEWTDSDAGGFVGLFFGRGVGLGVGDAAYGAERDGVGLGRFGCSGE